MGGVEQRGMGRNRGRRRGRIEGGGGVEYREGGGGCIIEGIRNEIEAERKSGRKRLTN